jgi:protein-disulfide isomerase
MESVETYTLHVLLYPKFSPSMDNNHSHSGIYAAIAISALVSLVANYFLIQQPQIDQVGGRANYKLYKEMTNNPKYADNVKQSLEAQANMLNGEQPTNTDQPTQQQPEPKATGTLTTSDIAGLTKDTYVKGDATADILWIEYSDLECPFCKRLHDSGAIKNLEAKYGSKLALAFKHYPLPFHPTAMPAAQAAECVGQAGGSKEYFAFVEGVFAKGTPTQAVIDEVVKSLGLDTAAIKKCVDAGTFKARVDAHQSEGSSKFGVNGTPGNVLINTKTGKYEVVSGAQPEANFDAAITRLMAE